MCYKQLPFAEILDVSSIFSGKAMQDATRYFTTRLIDDEKKLIRAISSPLFHSLLELGQGMWEVISAPKVVHIKNLIQISFFVYGKAKVMMLDFVYNFIDTYFSRSDYQLGHTDTDSLYLAFSQTESGNFEDLVKPHLRRNYFENRGNFLPTEVCQNPDCRQAYVECRVNHSPWEQPPCCAEAALYDKRTPGLFKTEYEGSEMCFLNPKTYCCTGSKGYKLGCKGVVKALNPLKISHFKRILFDRGDRGNSHLVKNANFRFIDGKMRTQFQYKYGLNGIFIKRKVLPDKINTEPLDL